MLSKISTISLIALLLLGTSCSNLSSLDKPVCVEHSMTEGHCITIIGGKKTIVNEENLLDGKTWFEIRPYFILVPPNTWSVIKKYIINQCKKTNACDQEISSWDRTIETIDNLTEKQELLLFSNEQ